MPTCTEQSISQLWKAERPTAALTPRSPSPPLRTLGRLPSPQHPPDPGLTQRPAVKLREVIFNLVITVLELIRSQLLIGPTLWLSLCLWCTWKLASLPLSVLKWFLTICQTSPSERFRKKRTVLISGGSTVQGLHLARNFYCAGARVVMCEVEGFFDLTRFSTAVHSYYTVPHPGGVRANEYIHALCDIVQKEEVCYYIPVSSTSEAIYDALAKPHLELLNCTVFCPSSKEVRQLDDLLEILEKCRHAGMAAPLYYPVTSSDEISRLYDSGLLRTTRHFMTPVGSNGVRERDRLSLPPFRQDFRFPGEISSTKPWVIVQDVKGDHYVTCTTVKDGIVVANISCKQTENGGLMPVECPEITRWIQSLFYRLRLRPLSGHFTFEVVVTGTGVVVPLGIRVGVPLPYICHTSVHPRLVWKPCRHFSRQSSGPLVADVPSYWMGDAVLSALKKPSVESVNRLLGTVLDQREVLFTIWDPLPYCAFYHLLLPAQLVLSCLRGPTR